MTVYSPPINTRSTPEFVGIIYGTTENWQQEAIDQAKAELIKRNVTKEYQQKLIDQWEKEIKVEEIKEQQRLEKNATESYEFIEMLLIFFGAPLILLNKYYSSRPTLWQLKSQNYQLKFKQRASLLIGGLIFWVLFFWVIGKFNT